VGIGFMYQVLSAVAFIYSVFLQNLIVLLDKRSKLYLLWLLRWYMFQKIVAVFILGEDVRIEQVLFITLMLLKEQIFRIKKEIR
jgi:hypothetical protein